MNRQSFLQALGLIGASAVLPVDLIESITPAPAKELAAVIPTRFRLRDIVVFEDGTRAMIIMMKNQKVELRPLFSSQDIGNGCGMAKEYDKDTLPELIDFVFASVVGEGSRI